MIDWYNWFMMALCILTSGLLYRLSNIHNHDYNTWKELHDRYYELVREHKALKAKMEEE